jgi:FKBP-type peptidyl-prolyl cis-trans isomerase 2
MTQAQRGDKVKVHYTGKLDDGTVFDSSEGREPLEFTLGQGQVIPGFEEGVVGMEPGDSKTLNIPPEQAYGPHRPEGVFEIERSEIPPSIPLQEGMRLQANQQGGRTVELTVVEFDDSKVTLDGNHPLAGKDLTFDIELAEIG